MSHCNTPAPCEIVDQESLACLQRQVAALSARDDEMNARLNIVESLTAAYRVFEPGLFAFVSDQGYINATQGQVALSMESKGADAYLFGGNNQFGGSLDAALAAFGFAFDNDVGYPAFGGEDYDVSGGDALESKFPDLFTSTKHFYDVEFDKGDVHLFVLDLGLDTVPAEVGPTGFPVVGGAQYNWFIDAVRNSTRRWKIVMFHSPYVGIVVSSDLLALQLQMDWEFERLGIHLILNGAQQSTWHVRRNGLDILNASAMILPNAYIPNVSTNPALIDGASAGTYVAWKDTTGTAGLAAAAGSYLLIYADEQNLSYSVFNAPSNTELKAKTILR